MSKLVFLAAVTGLLTVLSGCAAKIQAIKEDTAQAQIKQNHGYLMLGLDTNANLKYLKIDGKRLMTFTRKDLRVGSGYILTSIPAGNYHLDQISFVYGGRYLDEQALKFTIKPNRINYIGSIELRQTPLSPYSRFSMLNQTSMGLEFLQQRFPKLLSSHPMVYAGPGEDNFLKLIGSQNKAVGTDKESQP